MKITVKEVRVLKTGENKKGKWELIKVTSDDGTEYTTFDKKAKHLNPGAVFEAEVELKEGKASFSEVSNVISQGEAQEKLFKQSRGASTDASIESQVAFKGMIELISTGMVKKDSKEYGATIEWAMSRLHSVEQIMATIEEAKFETHTTFEGNQETQSKPIDRQDSGEAVKTAGELFNWIMSHNKDIKMPRAWIEAEYKVTHEEILTIEKVQELYKAIKQKMSW